MYEHPDFGGGNAPSSVDSASEFAEGATGGADEAIAWAAPPTGLRAELEAQLHEDCALKVDGPDGHITEAEGAQLGDTVRALGGIVNATHGRMVLAMCRVIESGWWDGPGILSTRQWLAIHWATTGANVNRVISVAKKASAYPEVIEALVAGELSLEAAQLICRRVPVEFQSAFVGYGRNMTMAQLRACTQAVPTPTSKEPSDAPVSPDAPESPDGPEAAERPGEPPVGDPPRSTSFGERGDGRWGLNANLSAEDGSLIEAALQEARDRAFSAAEDPDEKLRLTWADALVDLARRSLAHADADSADGQPSDRTLVHFHYEFGQLYPEGSDQPLPHALARQILCDTDLVGIGFRDGRPIDVGRKTRVISRRLRRITLRRDRCCVVPGCGATRGLEVHHLIHWEDGGPTDAANLVAICKAHHRAHHHGLVNIFGDPYEGLTFTNANGKPIRARAPITPENTSAEALADDAQHAGMTSPDTHRFGATGGSLHRWSILPGPMPVTPRLPNLNPIRATTPDPTEPNDHSDDVIAGPPLEVPKAPPLRRVVQLSAADAPPPVRRQ